MRKGALVWRHIPGLVGSIRTAEGREEIMDEDLRGCMHIAVPNSSRGLLSSRGPFASLVVLGGKSTATSKEDRRISAAAATCSRKKSESAGIVEGRDNKAWATTEQFLKHPVALLALVPKDAALFAAGAAAGALAKTVTAPLDRIKLLMQTHSVRFAGESARKTIGFLEAVTLIGKEEGIRGYWKGNLPQVIRVIPYSAVQLFSYEIYKKLFSAKDGELSVLGRLAAGACAGMTSTLFTYPLDVLRLRLALEPGKRTMSQVAMSMLREEGIASFHAGLGPSLIGIAPYIAVNFCIFDLVKKSVPEKHRSRPETSLLTAFVSATVATLMCYPLDTVRRQMQLRSSPYGNVLEAFRGIVEREGAPGLYRGFVPNALKNLPNSRYLHSSAVLANFRKRISARMLFSSTSPGCLVSFSPVLLLGLCSIRLTVFDAEKGSRGRSGAFRLRRSIDCLLFPAAAVAVAVAAVNRSCTINQF